MMRKQIIKGDPTSTGGRVLEGTGDYKIIDTPVALIGMEASCPACEKGRGPIIQVGAHKTKISGRYVALEYDYIACDCPPHKNELIGTQTQVEE